MPIDETHYRKSHSIDTSRRKLLNSGAAWGAYGLLAACGSHGNAQRGVKKFLSGGSSSQSAHQPEILDCLILGAGVAGLTAARDLSTWGKRVLVLEGSTRIGGRILTDDRPLGGVIELGAEYIHRGPRDVPLWDEVKRYDIGTDKINKNKRSKIFHPKFPHGKSPFFAGLAWSPWQSLLMFPKIDLYNGPDMSGAAWIAKHNYKDEARDFVAMALTGHMPAFLDRISVRGFDADNLSQQLKENDEYALPGGYGELVTRLAAQVPIQTDQNVERVVHNQDGVTVMTTDGRTYRARTAICTFSVGMLKSHAVSFEPGLHPMQYDALHCLEAGYHSKVALMFDRRFWDKDLSMVHNPWNGRQTGKTFFLSRENNGAVVTALIMGDDARRTDPLPSGVLVTKICADLDQMFPAAAPTMRWVRRDGFGRFVMARKHWMNDPFARGGNAYLTTAPTQAVTVGKARATLARPDLSAPLFLAGEATAIETQPASVHGAHASGKRAALQAWSLLSNRSLPSLRWTTSKIMRR